MYNAESITHTTAFTTDPSVYLSQVNIENKNVSGTDAL